MVKVEGRYFDGILKSNLDLLQEAIAINFDGILLCTGGEGNGKSTLVSQIAWYMDRDICIERVVFTGEQFLEACLNSNPGQCIVFDESYLSFNSRSHAEKTTKILVSMLTMIRKKRLCIIIVAPTFFDMNKYIAIHRTRLLFDVYTNILQRGFFSMYSRKSKLKLFMKGKKYNDMSAAQPDYRGRFTNWSPYDMNAYDEKKESALQEFTLRKDPTPRTDEELKKYKINAQMDMLDYMRNNKLLKEGSINNLAINYFDILPTSLSSRVTRFSKRRNTDV